MSKDTSLAPFALTARQLANDLSPRVLPWAIFLLGFQPVSAVCKPIIPNCEGKFIIVLPPPGYLEMMYLVVENSVNENNNESNRKHENVRVIKKNQRNAGILRKKVKRNEVQPLSYPSSKVKECNDVFRLFR